MNWLCWHVGTVTDPKFRVVAKMAHNQVGVVVAVWAYLLELAGSAKERGSIASYDADVAEEALGFSASEIEAVIVAMRDKGLIVDSQISKWKDRQNLTNAERAKEWRDARKAAREQNEQTDVRDVLTNAPNETNTTDRQTRQTDRQTKEREGASQAPPRPRASRLPDDWKPEAEPTIPSDVAERELPKFRDYWRAKAGKDATKLDWQATWRNWCRRAADDKQARNQAGNWSTASSGAGPVSDIESQWRARLRAYKPRGFWSPNWGNRPEEGNRDIPPAVYEAWRDGTLQAGAA